MFGEVLENLLRVVNRMDDEVSCRYRGKAIELGGSAKFPLLVDKNVEPSVMYESEDIIKHLWTNYGNTAVKPWTYFFARKVPFTGETNLSARQ